MSTRFWLDIVMLPILKTVPDVGSGVNWQMREIYECVFCKFELYKVEWMSKFQFICVFCHEKVDLTVETSLIDSFLSCCRCREMFTGQQPSRARTDHETKSNQHTRVVCLVEKQRRTTVYSM